MKSSTKLRDVAMDVGALDVAAPELHADRGRELLRHRRRQPVVEEHVGGREDADERSRSWPDRSPARSRGPARRVRCRAPSVRLGLPTLVLLRELRLAVLAGVVRVGAPAAPSLPLPDRIVASRRGAARACRCRRRRCRRSRRCGRARSAGRGRTSGCVIERPAILRVERRRRDVERGAAHRQPVLDAPSRRARRLGISSPARRRPDRPRRR